MTNSSPWESPFIEVYLLKMVIFQFAMLNNQMVHDVDENGSMMMFPNQAFYIVVSPFK